MVGARRVLWLAALAAAGRLAAAATFELPAELPLGADSQLAIELHHAEVHLTSRADGPPAIRARIAGEGESAGLAAVSGGGSLNVRRVEAAEKTRLRLDLTLGPGRTVYVVGYGLDVKVDDPVPAPEDGSGRSVFHLALESSRAELAGARVGQLELDDSSLRLSGTGGSLALTVAGGSADLRRHRGSLDLTITESEVTVIDHQGRLTPRLEGGRLEVTGGGGTLTGTAAGAVVIFNGRQGPIELRASDASVDVRGAEGGGPLRLDGRDLQVLLEAVRGPVTADLRGGSLLGRGLRQLQATAAGGARIELAEVSGSVGLDLSEGAEAYLTDAGQLEAAVTDARLEAQRVGQLTLTGARGEVSARGVERVTSLEARDSELFLDLSGVRHHPSLALRGASAARVLLPEPCIVEGAGRSVEVTGCEVGSSDQRLSPRQQRLRYGDRRPTRLTVTAGPDADVVVEGVEVER